MAKEKETLNETSLSQSINNVGEQLLKLSDEQFKNLLEQHKQGFWTQALLKANTFNLLPLPEKETIFKIRDYTSEQIKDKILELLNSIDREGKENLIEWLVTSDFFTAPASTKYHSTSAGGLAKHSLFVYKLFADKVDYFNIEMNKDSIIVASLLHDLCKVDFYYRDFKWVKNNETNQWMKDPIWKVHDKLPLGHGEKSIYLAQKYIQLTDEEAILIRWHLQFSEPGVHFNFPGGLPFLNAMDLYPICVFLSTADFEARMLIK